MKSEEVSKETVASVIVKVITYWKSIFMFWSFITGLVLIFCGALYLTVLILRPLFSTASVTVTEHGAYIIEMQGKRKFHWLFTASSMWESSGIKVHKDDEIKFSISGKANLAVHHLVKSAEDDSIPYFHWSGPDGDNEIQRKFYRDADHHRQKKRIAVGENPGILLMQVVPDGNSPILRPDNKTCDCLYVVGSGKQGNIRIRQSGILYFALNDIPLDPNMENYYVITPEIDQDYAKRHNVQTQKRKWEQIVKWGYWNLWFDDNVGYFVISAEIN